MEELSFAQRIQDDPRHSHLVVGKVRSGLCRHHGWLFQQTSAWQRWGCKLMKNFIKGFRKCLQIELWKTALPCSPAHSLPTKPHIIALPFLCPQNLSSGIIDFLQFKSAGIFEKRLRPFEPGLWSPTVIVLPISLCDETMTLTANSHKFSFASLTSCSVTFWGAQQHPVD